MFASLGFEPSGHHRTKAVARWTQGGINFVINAEEEGFAANYRNAHGPAICAIGLRVPDPAAAMSRGAALGVAAFTQDPGPGNLAMPALRGVGGSLLYLLQDGATAAIWDREFETHQHRAGGAGLRAVDHLAASVRADEFLSWKLYWRALFDLREQEAQDVIDPSGLVQSQAIESDDGRFRVTLNSSDAQRTLSARFLTHAFGAGFQHIAMASDDVFATAEVLRALGAPHLDIPANYYDDLAARFGLDEALLARMEALGILYDADLVGQRYWQVYTRAFDKRFFFEVVQRDGYGGYGASNAGIRLAAQSRFRADAVAI